MSELPHLPQVPFTAEALARVGRTAAELAWAEGMTVLKPDGSVVPIPLLAEPEVMARDALAGAAREAELILSGAVKLARHLATGGDGRDRAALAEPFSGLEAEAMAILFSRAPLPVMVARVDFLVPETGGAPRALELNATIPAMPAYADLATFSWLRAAARERGLSPRQEADLVARTGSHMERLREALVAYYRQRGGTRERPSIAIVARPGDAQIGELRRLAQHFRQMGHRVENLVPQDCVPEDWDVLYRHVWANRVDPNTPFARALRAPDRYVLANPVNGLLEAKALFARLSECAEDARSRTAPGSRRTSAAPRRGSRGRGGSSRRCARSSSRTGAPTCSSAAGTTAGRACTSAPSSSPRPGPRRWTRRSPIRAAAASSCRSGSSRGAGPRPASRPTAPTPACSTGTSRPTAASAPRGRTARWCAPRRRPS
ncbi:MAG: hypothetical protein U0229_04220 [Anaeromyxobacter sp.]